MCRTTCKRQALYCSSFPHVKENKSKNLSSCSLMCIYIFFYSNLGTWRAFSEGHQRAVAAIQHGHREPGTNPVCLLHQRKHQLQRRTRDGHGRNRESCQDGQHSRLCLFAPNGKHSIKLTSYVEVAYAGVFQGRYFPIWCTTQYPRVPLCVAPQELMNNLLCILQRYFALFKPKYSSPPKKRRRNKQNGRFLLGTPGYGLCNLLQAIMPY